MYRHTVYIASTCSSGFLEIAKPHNRRGSNNLRNFEFNLLQICLAWELCSHHDKVNQFGSRVPADYNAKIRLGSFNSA